MPIQSKNPATGEVEKVFDPITPDVREEKVALAESAYLLWKRMTLEERSALMKKAATVLRENSDRYAETMTQEMGKPILQAKGEVEKCAWVCDHYAEESGRYLSPEEIKTDASSSYVQFDPLGVILFVMPWNFPLWQVFRAGAPTIMAGNTVLLKHASNVPACALICEEVFLKAGFPVGVFQTLLIEAKEVESILRDERIKGVSLTGSEKAGRAVAAIAGSEVKPAVMELGGSDPFIVLNDADMVLTCESAKNARLLNGGQVCISSKRFVVHSSRFAEFTEKMKVIFESYVVGDPMKGETNMGPMSSEQGLLDIERQVNESVAMGATIVTGGKRVSDRGYFYAPTILTNVTHEMPVWNEETFGPVLAIVPFETDEEAIAIANDSPYGLSSCLFTSDPERARKLIPQIESGSVFVNGFSKTDPRLPVGGVKHSGLGREIGEWGIRAFTNVKSVWVK